MRILSTLSKIAEALGVSLTLSMEYLLFAGSVFIFFYVWKKKAFWYLKIQQKFPGREHVIREAKYSFFTVIIFGLVILPVMWATRERYTLVYYPINKYGYAYYFFSIVLMIVVHDAYYYWTHRLLHWKNIFKYVHKTHHLSLNPTPFSAYALHPVEALINVSIIPLIVFTIPYHVSAITVFSAYTLMMNVGGHMGHEFFPKGFATNKWFKWHNTATHHNMHHRYVKYNFGIYFNFWDRVMKTNHPKYEDHFEQVIVQREQEKLVRDTLQAPVKVDVTFPKPKEALL